MAPHVITLRQMQYAVAVGALDSFRRAAEACHVSQPSLSAQLAVLERGLGALLFDRSRRRVMPTVAGAALLERMRRVLRDTDELVDAAVRLGDPLTSTLRVGVLPTISPYLLPKIVPAVRRHFPRLTLEWTEDRTDALVRAVDAGTLDGALLALEAPIGNLEKVVVAEDPFVLAASKRHDLARKKGPVRPYELYDQNIFLLDDGHCFREQALAVCAKVGAREMGFRATSLATLVQMVAGGAGVTLLPRMAASVENRGGALVVRRFAPPGPRRTIALVWRWSSPAADALRALGAVLRKAAGTKREPAPDRTGEGR